MSVKRKRVLITAGILIVSFTVAACSRNEAVETTRMQVQVKEENPSQAAETAAARKEQLVSPLTGLPVSAAQTVRPVMVMINNHPAARPQSGLSQADIVYECLAEGEITRFVAVYQSKSFAEPIGPVRSIRPYYIDLGKIYNAVEVHAGGSPDAYQMLDEQKIDYLDEITNAGKYFWRESARKAPHNLYTDLSRIQEAEVKHGMNPAIAPDRVLTAFATEHDKLQGIAATSIDVTFWKEDYKVTYTYDPVQKDYVRFINGVPHKDKNTDIQLRTTNLIVLSAEHQVLDSEGRRDVKLVGTGAGYVFQQGEAEAVTWKRKEAGDAFHLYNERSEEIKPLPGTTHILIVPSQPGMDKWVRIT